MPDPRRSPEPTTRPARPVLIAIAPAGADRERLARLVDSVGPVLLVSDAQEARALLEAAPSATAHERPGREVTLDGLRVDSDRHVAEWEGQELALTPLEHDLLVCLLSEPGRTWAFDRLHEAVWGTRHLGTGSDLHSLVKRVRRKLATLGTPHVIAAIRGVGFRLARADSVRPSSLRSVGSAVS